MFIKTMAVGPFEPVVDGATVALPLRHCDVYVDSSDEAGAVHVARLAARDNGARRAIVENVKAGGRLVYLCCGKGGRARCSM
jgi:N-acetylmuramic acid 6-phosphate (MurNAc-6-P) etherase